MECHRTIKKIFSLIAVPVIAVSVVAVSIIGWWSSPWNRSPGDRCAFVWITFDVTTTYFALFDSKHYEPHRFTWYIMYKKTDVLLVIFGDILGTVTRLFLLRPTCRNCPLRSFLGSKLFWIFFLRYVWNVYRVLGYYFLRNYISWLVYFLCIVQSEEDLWRFQVEAQEAYMCKQILCLCQW